MNEKIERIKIKLRQLKKLDKYFTLFGSQKHRYKLNPVISVDTISLFELMQKIILPVEYILFLTEVGSGGAGPFYGLEPFTNVLFDNLDYQRPDSLLDPSKPFVHTEPWNMEFKSSVDEEEDEDEYERQFAEFEEMYFDKEQLNGIIAICNYGCAVNLNLVVNGLEYGHIWTDDRGSDNGIHPSCELGNKDKITFLNWYELWLDNSLNEINSKNPTLETVIASNLELSEKNIAMVEIMVNYHIDDQLCKSMVNNCLKKTNESNYNEKYCIQRNWS